MGNYDAGSVSYTNLLGELAATEEANLVLMGIEPTYPSEKYGYIIPTSTQSVSDVSVFKEKPTEEIAKGYIAQGALWLSLIHICWHSRMALL